MNWFRKKTDPVSERAQALSAEIAALEAQIRQLDDQLHHAPESLVATAVATATLTASSSDQVLPGDRDRRSVSALALGSEPVFETISVERITREPEMPNLPEQFNEFGMRKFDFPAFVQRTRTFFTGPSTSNPKLVRYLSAGGVQGLRPLRKEKRVARNRFILFSALLFVVLFGTLWWFLRTR
jgi:hypothetical protein